MDVKTDAAFKMSQSDQNITDSKKGANLLRKDLCAFSGKPHFGFDNPCESDRHTSLDDTHILMTSVMIIL